MNFLGYKLVREKKSTITKGDNPNSSYHPPSSAAVKSYFGNLTNDKILKIFNNCSPVFACIDIISRANANKRYVIKDLKTREPIPQDFTSPVIDKVRQLLSNPNPLQSGSEYERYAAAYYWLYGNSYDMGNINIPIKSTDLLDIKTMTLLPSQYVKINATDNYFYATEITEIINNYIVQYPNVSKSDVFNPYQINHSNETNLAFNRGNNNNDDALWLKGVPRIKRLQYEIKNNEGSLDSLNNIIENRGILGMFTPQNSDADGSGVVLGSEEKRIIREELSHYGATRGQDMYKFLSFPMNYQKTAMTPEELGIFNSISQSWITVATVFGVPKLLVAQHLTGATFENQTQSNKELYLNNIIPYSEARVNSLNNWFKLKDYGYYLDVSFDHLPFMQDDKVKAASAKKQNGETFKQAFYSGTVNYNSWLNSISEPENLSFGDNYIFDLDEKQLKIIGIETKTSNDAK
jgi:phage portal protein BeeE